MKLLNARGLIILAFVPLMIAATVVKSPSRYLYVWAGTAHDSTRGLDMVTVIDANPASKTYGAVVAALTVDSSGLMPHPMEARAA